MSGGLMQLVAYGAQDVFLTGMPEITFFKSAYRRHTNFAMESIENPFNGAPNFGKKVTCTIQRNGDLIHRMYLQATLPQVALQSSDGSGAQFRWLNWVGHNLINNVYVEIGGQQIDKHYGDWLHIWNELTQEPGKQSGYAEMVGNVPELVNLLVQGGEDAAERIGAGGIIGDEDPAIVRPLAALLVVKVRAIVSGRGMDHRGISWTAGGGPGLSIAREADQDETGIVLRQCLIAQAPFLERPRPEILDHDVAMFH